VRAAFALNRDGVGELRVLADGDALAPVDDVDDAAAGSWPADLAQVAELERSASPRWVLADVAATYPALLRCGVRLSRCHDLASTEALLLAAEGDAAGAAAVTAARAGAATSASEPAPQPSLFDDEPAPASAASPDAKGIGETYAGQLARLDRIRARLPGFGLLVAAESASCMAAAEMTAVGVPWDAGTHDRLLTELLGARPPSPSVRPAKLQALAEEAAAALDDPRVNLDSQVDLLRSLRRAGLPVTSTRRHELRRHEHPAVAPLVRYRELARLHAAHGWAWRDQWVRDGRFHPEYVPGGVVSGRWATRGGGALQIPKAVRAAVVAPPGRLLVVADAGQLEPRVLAALARDPGLVAATTEGDLYTALAREALGRPEARAEMKVALLSAMYGGGAGSPALAALRRRFPGALALLETAARTGEAGGSVHSVLGRTSPAAPPDWLSGLPDPAAGARSRAYGRFTRNFVIQASAADWAAVLLATLRLSLADLRDGGFAELVFFQHDEVVVEVDAPLAAAAVDAVHAAGATATRLVLGETGVHVPLEARAVASYADG
jgi:DNA polymerase I